MAKKNIQPRWFFPTNTNNLRMILAQGLITSPRGFRKYYQDALEYYDGFLPLFKNNVPKKYMDKATLESSHLTPCLLELDLEEILESMDGTSDMRLIPLPLPLICIKKIIFQNKQAIVDFKKDAKGRANVFLTGLKLQSTIVDSKLFEEVPPPAAQLGLAEKACPNLNNLGLTCSENPDYSLIYAYGGMLAMLFYFSKSGEKSHAFFEQFIDKDGAFTSGSSLPIAKLAHDFFYHGIDESKPEMKIIKGILDCCLTSTDFKNSMITFLEDDSWGNALAERKKELANTLREYAIHSSHSASELFNKAQSDIERLLLMLFTREDSQSFIEYKNDNINFSESEYILYALFFGVRDGFIKTPAMIRKYKGLQAYISYKMADYAHKKMNSGISFKTIQPPTTVWQFVDKNISKQTVKELKIQSCVKTVMPKLDFTHKNGKNVYDGYVEAKHEIDTTKYFETISTTIIDDTIYNKLK